MKLHNVAGRLESHLTEALVFYAYSDDKKLVADVKKAGLKRSLELLEKAFSEGVFKGNAKQTLFFRSVDADRFPHVLVVGVGSKDKLNEEALRNAGAVTAKALAREKIAKATFCVESIRKMTKSPQGAGSALAEGFLLGSYKYDELKSKGKEGKAGDEKSKSAGDEEKNKEIEVFFVLEDRALSRQFGQGIEVGTILAQATNFARDLGNAPANYLTPKSLAERTREACKGLPIKFRALNLQEIKALKMGCLIGVNKGSHEEPRFIIMEYNGGKKTGKPFVMVGKGLTFDSGGISIKPAGGMEEMKFDMCGSAAVIGAILAVAKLKLKVNVVTLVGSTENMPGGAAVKPGDVLVAMNGKTIEVNNTDAEGRLVLADALSYACEKYEPALIVDAATLTGACVVALGNHYTGVFTKDDKVMKSIQEASQKSGERIWRMPLTNEFAEEMRGTYADLSNMGAGKGGGSCQAAGFLSYFVDEKTPWAHFDIAGVAYHTGARGAYNPDKGASGAAVRLFVALAENLS